MAKIRDGVKVTKGKNRFISQILGVDVSSRTGIQVLDLVTGWLDEKGESKKEKMKKRLIFTPNSEILVEAAESEEFRKVLSSATLNIPDGMGVVLASRLLHWLRPGKIDQKISERVTGVGLMEDLLAVAARKGLKVYLLGGEGEEASMAALQIQKRWGEMNIKANPGPRKILRASEQEKMELIEGINRFGPDLLFVAFGHGKQERWLLENIEKLDIRIGMGVGGALRYMAGMAKQPPVWIGRMGLEWLWRLVDEPWRWKRQLKLFKFWWLVIREGVS